VKEQLLEVLRPVLGDVTIENLRALTGGASRTTWAFEAVADQRRALILRTGPPDDVHAGMELEAAVQQRAAAAGAPVPHILAADNSPAALGNPYLICDAIAGETISGESSAPSTSPPARGYCSSARRRWPPSTAPTRTGWA
jgi:aminoglycoside phosphotransferase (APT) family kinase protein